MEKEDHVSQVLSERQKVPVVGVFQGSTAKGSRKQKNKAMGFVL